LLEPVPGEAPARHQQQQPATLTTQNICDAENAGPSGTLKTQTDANTGTPDIADDYNW